jgi:hypothetical protein
MNRKNSLAGITLVLLAGAASAGAEVNTCTDVPTLPFAITTPGIYCLNKDLDYAVASGIALQIQANDVVLDLNGHTMNGLPAGPATLTYGILASNRTSVTIRNGTVRGFYIGIQTGGRNPQNNIVEDMRADQNTTYGIVVRGQGSIARHNLVTRTGGVAGGLTIGLYGLGDGVHVVDNEVVGTVEGVGGTAFGIKVDSGIGAVVEHNVVSNASYGPTDSYGIGFSVSSPRGTVVGNRIVNMRKGIFFDFGGSGLYMDNTVGSAVAPFTGGTAAGATNFVF